MSNETLTEGRTIIPFSEWKEEFEKRGKMKCRFKCPMCGNIQTPEELKEVGADPEDAYFNCIGRFTKAKGCDWSLGGLFQIHKVCVEKDGEYHAVFEFAD